jgi:hypothetical protein
MENSIYYTFSTIAQALGGAFALLSAFILYRFQSLNDSMLNASVGLKSIWNDPADAESYEILRRLSVWPQLNKAIDAQVAKRSAADPRYPPFEVIAAVTRLHAGESLHRFLTQVFWVSVILTFLVMSGSVAVIPYAHEISASRTLGSIHLLNIAGIVGFALCMLSYVVVIYAALVSNYGRALVQQRIDALINGP